ncbi:hypothetical protein HHI36_019335 [Cryptolaemus montrouzieri]|uniref:Alcohol dehydrogenase n=1 Tax=Cryptolaemus montrouzieri TaxID=559131 RepID=A0ABD2P3C9_9CUCU
MELISTRQEHSKEDCSSPPKEVAGECPCQPPKIKGNNSTMPCPRMQEELFNLNCKTAVVVGGEDGIGFATADCMLCHHAKVVGIFGINVCKGTEACHCLNCKYGHKKAVFYRVDVNSTSDLECAICKLTQEHGRIEAFVNAFGICHGKEWENELTTNMVGMARSTIVAHKYLSESRRGGVIVNTSGIFGFIPLAGCPTLSAAQHGIIGLSKSFGHQDIFKQSNVRVIALCPGITNSRLFRKANIRAMTPHMGKCLTEQIETMKKQKPEICAQSIVWLLKFGDSGSIWLIEDKKFYKIQCNLPHCCSELYQQLPG